MDARLPALSAEELSAVGAGASLVGGNELVERIKDALFHHHASKRNIWKDYGSSTLR